MTCAVSALGVEVLSDPQALAHRVADWMLDLARATDGRFTVALSGGSTPQSLYRQLALSPYREAFPWARTHLFWGDERFAPHEDVRSNYRMVQEALLAHVPIPPANVHATPTEGLSLWDAASTYERELKTLYGAKRLDPERPLFDLTLLGLGVDGHTASLFPDSAVLTERDRWVSAVTDSGAEPRVTLTYPALESSRHAAFLVAGPDKRGVFDRLRRGDDSIPASRLRPTGALRAFVDAAAVNT